MKHETIERCRKELANGERCDRPVGYCIHSWKPTLFGARKVRNEEVRNLRTFRVEPA